MDVLFFFFANRVISQLFLLKGWDPQVEVQDPIRALTIKITAVGLIVTEHRHTHHHNQLAQHEGHFPEESHNYQMLELAQISNQYFHNLNFHLHLHSHHPLDIPILKRPHL